MVFPNSATLGVPIAILPPVPTPVLAPDSGAYLPGASARFKSADGDQAVMAKTAKAANARNSV